MFKQVIYISASTHRFQEDELERILAFAREKNRADDITGLLLYQGGTFLQVLEGPADKVDETLARICKDRRHNSITVLHESLEPERIFSDWEMGYLILEPSDNFTAVNFAQAMNERFNINVFRENEDEAEQYIRLFVDSTSVKH